MLRLTLLIAFLLLMACQSNPRGDTEGGFYSYVDAQGNLVTVERDAESEAGREDTQGEARGLPQAGDPGEQPDKTIQERATDDSPDGGNKEFMQVRPENYQTTGEARERMREEVNEDETDRFVSYRGPAGEIITRPLDLEAEREAAEQREQERGPEFERLPEGERYKESTTRVPADCCRHLTEAAPLLTVDSNFTLEFGTSSTVQLNTQRPARALRLGPGVGGLEVQSYIRSQDYLAPRLLMLNEDGKPILKINSLFTRHYPETWARYGYMDGWLERSSRDFAYVVFYLPYARVGARGLALDPRAPREDGDHRRSLKGELAVTGRVQGIERGQGSE